jgi:hypothetical protein
MHFLAAALAGLALGPGSTSASNVAPCDKAIIGHGSADWRSESIVAGPVGVRRHPLQQMSETGNGQLTSKMPVLVEGHTPVTVSIPPRMRDRVFLYYGRVLGHDGLPTTSFNDARGYDETEFQPCDGKPRTIWPGGIRIKGRKPVQLLVTVEGRPDSIPLPLGQPKLYKPPR